MKLPPESPEGGEAVSGHPCHGCQEFSTVMSSMRHAAVPSRSINLGPSLTTNTVGAFIP